MPYSDEARPLLEELITITEAGGDAVKALHDYLASGGKDHARIMQLAETVDQAYYRKNEVYSELKQYRLEAPQAVE